MKISKIGVAIDIDGVLMKGRSVLPRASEAIKLLIYNKIPHIFITNGGGMLEDKKCKTLKTKLDINRITSDQMLLAHTPMKDLVSQYKDSRVLVLGCDEVLNVAKQYGFKKITSCKQLHYHYPDIFPLRKPEPHPCPYHGQSIEAALIFHDPHDWALDIQVLSDVLIGQFSTKTNNNNNDTKDTNNNNDSTPTTTNNNNSSSSSSIQLLPLYASNADLVYTTEYPLPRYTQGAFAEAFRCLFEQYTGSQLFINYCGKPFTVQYQYAEDMLALQAKKLGVEKPVKFYGIGDNPKADIRGANNAGDHWHSVLVRTGVFKGSNDDNDASDKADVVVDDIYDAINTIINDNNNK